VAGFQQEFKDGFFERRLETADYDAIGCATRLGSSTAGETTREAKKATFRRSSRAGFPV